MKPRFELIIFDFDGTLADSFPWFTGELNQVAKRWGFRAVADSEMDTLRYMSAGAVLRYLGVARWQLPWVAGDIRARMGRDIERIRLFAGVPEMLDALTGSGLRLAIASSNDEANIARVLGPRLLGKLVALECNAALSRKDARLKRLLRRSRTAAPKTVYVGDEVRDIDAARRAGIASGAVTWGYNHPAALAAEHPDLLFHRVADVAKSLSGGK